MQICWETNPWRYYWFSLHFMIKLSPVLTWSVCKKLYLYTNKVLISNSMLSCYQMLKALYIYIYIYFQDLVATQHRVRIEVPDTIWSCQICINRSNLKLPKDWKQLLAARKFRAHYPSFGLTLAHHQVRILTFWELVTAKAQMHKYIEHSFRKYICDDVTAHHDDVTSGFLQIYRNMGLWHIKWKVIKHSLWKKTCDDVTTDPDDVTSMVIPQRQ